MDKNTTLFGGKTITVHFESIFADGSTTPDAQVKVRQIPVREYETGFPFVDDEPALAGFLCGKDKPWAINLTPESFEEVLTIGREVNAKGFFSFCQRRTERAAREQAAMIGIMATLPPETLKAAMERGLAIQAQSRSPILSPGFVSPPAR
jgi:hypothetical protein